MILQDLETERLILRGISEEDVDFIFQQFSNEDVTRYLFDAEPTQTLQEALEIVQMYTLQKKVTAHRWIIVLKESNTKIGTLGFHIWKRETQTCEIGYDLQPNFWGKGFGKEAVKAMLDYIVPTLQLNTITACIYEENIGSSALVKSLGFTDSLERRTERFRGKEYLHSIYKKGVRYETDQ